MSDKDPSLIAILITIAPANQVGSSLQQGSFQVPDWCVEGTDGCGTQSHCQPSHSHTSWQNSSLEPKFKTVGPNLARYWIYDMGLEKKYDRFEAPR